MGKSLISNPPYNIKWEQPVFGQLQPRFFGYDLPPKSNANFAFLLTALDFIDEKAALLLPCGVLQGGTKEEENIRKEMVKNNFIEAVIILPEKMFESTSITTCIILLNKSKRTTKIEMVDMRKQCEQEERLQNGQYGGATHEKRTYKKIVNVLSDTAIEKCLCAISEQKNIVGFCKSVSVKEIEECGWSISPPRYVECEEVDVRHRDYKDIAEDYNRVIMAKNAVKLTVNESLAKTLGLYDVFLQMKKDIDVAKSFEVVGQKVEKENFIFLSKNKAEFKIENKETEKFPEIFLLFINLWKQRIIYLNNEENRLLAEMRDALIPDLMTNKINLENK